MAMEVLGNWSHWVIADGSEELCAGEFGALCKARGLWDLLMEGLGKQSPDPDSPAKDMITPWKKKDLTL